MDIISILIAVFCAILIIAVFAYSIKQNKDEKRPPVNFIRELFNHFGDANNYKR